MYKTVRHGENSLQYTILPQQDDPSGSHGPRKRRHTRTATIVIVVLVLGCLVVTAAIVLPLLITANIIKLPVAFKKFSPFSSTDKDVHETRNYDRLVLPPRPDKGSNVSIGVTPQSTTVGLTTSNDNLNTLTTLPIAGSNLNNNKTGKLEDSVVTRLPSEDSTRRLSAINNGTSRNVVQQLMMTDSLTTERSPDIRPSTQATMAASRVFVDGGGFVATLADDPVRKNDAGDSMGILPARNGSSTRIIVEALMPSNADIRRSEPTSTSGSRVVVVGPQTSRPTLQTKNQSWLQPRWPFADPSAYFQWTGYGGRDSLILPVILGGATLILLMSACACYAIRRRRQKAIRRQTIGKISSDLQAGDKANLLPDGSEEE